MKEDDEYGCVEQAKAHSRLTVGRLIDGLNMLQCMCEVRGAGCMPGALRGQGGRGGGGGSSPRWR